MKNLTCKYRNLAVAITASLLMAACATVSTTPDGAISARNKLTQLQSNAQLASLAPIEIQDAELAVIAAEHPESDQALTEHLVLIATRKVETASLWAQSRLYEDQRKALSQESDAARLDSRTREVNSARRDTEIAENNATFAREQADAARADTAAAELEAANLARQVSELNARETDRGLVVTLGDILFATGKSAIVGSNNNNLGKLAMFLNEYPDRTVTIEGHTDDVGNEDSNMSLSQHRADAVKSYLVSQGIADARLSAYGKGENSPVSGNDSDTGRQQNRRVEVIIANSTTSL